MFLLVNLVIVTFHVKDYHFLVWTWLFSVIWIIPFLLWWHMFSKYHIKSIIILMTVSHSRIEIFPMAEFISPFWNKLSYFTEKYKPERWNLIFKFWIITGLKSNSPLLTSREKQVYLLFPNAPNPLQTLFLPAIYK